MSALDAGSELGRVLRAHAPVVDPWLRRAAATGAEGGTVRAALAEVAPLATALAAGGDDAGDADAAEQAVLATVRAVLDLVGRGRWHPGRAQRTAVLEVLPVVAAWARSAPATAVPALVAAADVVGRAGRLDAWAARLTGPPPPPERLRGALLVGAWRAGLARYRDAALREAAGLDPAVLGPLLGVDPTSTSAVLERHGDDRWWWPGAPQGTGVVRTVGGFGPWGGTWLRLPVALAGGPTGWVAVAGREPGRWSPTCTAPRSSPCRARRRPRRRDRPRCPTCPCRGTTTRPASPRPPADGCCW